MEMIRKFFVEKLGMLLLVLIFGFSVYVRLPNIDKPLSYHHEWLTAHTLITLQSWGQSSIFSLYASPVFNFQNPADRYPLSFPGAVFDQSGNMYYLSYGPFGFWLPYFVLKVLGVFPDVLPLQIFNMSLHFLGGLGIYFIVNELTRKRATQFSFAAVLAYCAYIFASEMLWFGSNVYFSDMLAQVGFIFAVYLVLLYKRIDRKYLLALLCVMLFLTTLTEWIGVFLTFLISVYFLFYRKQIRISLMIGASSLAAVLAIFVLYSQIAGLSQLLSSMNEKYMIRSGVSDSVGGLKSTFNKESLDIIYGYYLKGYWPVLYSVGLIAVINLFVVSKIKHLFDRNSIVALYLIVGSIGLHHLIFLNFTIAHDFSVFKTGFLFAVLLGLMFEKLFEYRNSQWLKYGSAAIFGFFIINYSMISYYKENPKEYRSYDYFKRAGTAILNNAKPTETVYMVNGGFNPMLTFYAKRSVHSAIDRVDVLSQMTSRGDKKAVFIILDPSGDLDSVERFEK